MEPSDLKKPKDNFLQKVRDLAHENGALFIFDEVLTGFRLALGGAQEYFKVEPDLACIGKAMANGMDKATALVSRHSDVMLAAMMTAGMFTFAGQLAEGHRW
jgi:glutamate-1-semialdehyde aminotransferase